MPGALLCCSARQAHRGVPLAGVLLCSSECQVFDGPSSLLFSCLMLAVGRERLWWRLHSLCMTQQYRFASMAARLCSTGISHHDLLPHIPLIHVSAVNSSPHTGIAPQSLNSSSKLSFQETLVSAQRVYGCGKDCLILIPFRLPQISCFILSLKCFSSDSDNCPDVGIGSLLQFPTCRGQVRSY